MLHFQIAQIFRSNNATDLHPSFRIQPQLLAEHIPPRRLQKSVALEIGAKMMRIYVNLAGGGCQKSLFLMHHSLARLQNIIPSPPPDAGTLPPKILLD
jgi:hypothetical protein